MFEDYVDGMRVVMNEHFLLEECVGWEGIVRGGGDMMFAVEFKQHNTFFHTCNGRCPRTTGYWVKIHEMEPVGQPPLKGLSAFLAKTAV